MEDRSRRELWTLVHDQHCALTPPPNGSRLSCGRRARGRKAVEPQTKRLARERTQFFPPERRARWLLVEAAWRILRSKDAAGAPLRGWARPIVARRGSRIAVVAVARRLAGILYAMWRDGAPYDADKIRRPRSARQNPAA